jgi:hypothetical protein
MTEETKDYYLQQRKRIKEDILDLAGESVRLLGTLYEKGEFSHANQMAVYAREKLIRKDLMDDLYSIERLLGLR